jgi:hypothetical protein
MNGKKIVFRIILSILAIIVLILIGSVWRSNNYYTISYELEDLQTGKYKFGDKGYAMEPRWVFNCESSDGMRRYQTVLGQDATGTIILYESDDFENTNRNRDYFNEWHLFAACYFPRWHSPPDHSETWFFCDTNRMAQYITTCMKARTDQFKK